ncbi:MAG: metal-sulfur cluster assembly factor [Armatimonadetes bacterium]|nr:metal-sulfur cluster assembly factor [Armatimonadota bacterium]
MVTEEQIIEVLKTCFDPEIPVNIYDLGLIYHIDVQGDRIKIRMTLTAMGCAMGPMLAQEITQKLLTMDGVEDVNVELVYTPPWTPEKLTEDGRLALQSMGFPV